jgi:hypothetical protein
LTMLSLILPNAWSTMLDIAFFILSSVPRERQYCYDDNHKANYQKVGYTRQVR